MQRSNLYRHGRFTSLLFRLAGARVGKTLISSANFAPHRIFLRSIFFNSTPAADVRGISLKSVIPLLLSGVLCHCFKCVVLGMEALSARGWVYSSKGRTRRWMWRRWHRRQSFHGTGSSCFWAAGWFGVACVPTNRLHRLPQYQYRIHFCRPVK